MTGQSKQSCKKYILSINWHCLYSQSTRNTKTLESLVVIAARLIPLTDSVHRRMFSFVVLQREFISSVKKLFRRRSNSGSAHKKRIKKEPKMKVTYDSKPSGTVTMVTLCQPKNLHKAADELHGETLAQEYHQISVES